jgi:hypothetical protein
MEITHCPKADKVTRLIDYRPDAFECGRSFPEGYCLISHFPEPAQPMEVPYPTFAYLSFPYLNHHLSDPFTSTISPPSPSNISLSSHEVKEVEMDGPD